MNEMTLQDIGREVWLLVLDYGQRIGLDPTTPEGRDFFDKWLSITSRIDKCTPPPSRNLDARFE